MADLVDRMRSAGSRVRSSLRSARTRTVPAALIPGSELVHLGGGEQVSSPDVDLLPLDPATRRRGLGSSSLALPPARLHVLVGVRLCPGSRCVVASDGRVVAESFTSDMVPARPVEPESPLVEHVEGAVALFRSPQRGQYHTLIDHLPRAALLTHPALRRFGPITVVHDGPLTSMEQQILPALLGRNVRLREVSPDSTVVADRVLLPGYVTRPGAGAIPSWYRRWVDRHAAGLGRSDGPRRVFLDDGAGLAAEGAADALSVVLDQHGVVPLDPAALDAAERIAVFRDAELVVGLTGDDLANAVFSRKARLVELFPGPTMAPRYYYMASAKGLPYQVVSQTASGAHRTGGTFRPDPDVLDRALGALA